MLIRFYTGLEDYKTFKTLLDSLGPAVSNLLYYGTKTDSERLSSEDVIKRRPKITNSPEQEFFLVLARLRLGLLEEDIATRAELSQSHMSRILYYLLTSCIQGYVVFQFSHPEKQLINQCQFLLERCIL
jgi:AraC-like DNA-binding protein